MLQIVTGTVRGGSYGWTGDDETGYVDEFGGGREDDDFGSGCGRGSGRGEGRREGGTEGSA